MLKDYCNDVGGQGAASRRLNDVSTATINNILRDNWENISNEMWRKVAKQIGVYKKWQHADTHTNKMLQFYFADAQHHQMVHAIVHPSGGGKSHAAKQYLASHPGALYVQCSEYFNRKTFLGKILQTMGRETSGTTTEMMDRIIKYVIEADEPLLILDEADKLQDPVLSFFISLYNALEDNCGFILMATDYLQKMVEKGVAKNKRGYNEIYSRMGRRFIELRLDPEQRKEDIAAVCIANGVEDKTDLQDIIKKCDNDLRRVKKLVHSVKNKPKK